MDTLEFIKKRYNLTGNEPNPIVMPHGRQIELLKLYRHLGFKVGAEIGTASGFYAKRIVNNVPELKLFCIDPYLAYPDYMEEPRPEDQAHQDSQLVKAQERLTGFDVTFIKKTSRDAALDFADESLDFVYIDGNHTFEYAVEDIATWTKKVRKGGIIAGHDYWTSGTDKGWLKYEATPEQVRKLCQVQDAVDVWTKTNEIKPWFVFTNDKSPSWLWVKQ
jgi:predicted O-methyltransferase YrrM